MSARYRESLRRAGYILRRGIPVPVITTLMFFFSLQALRKPCTTIIWVRVLYGLTLYQ